MVEYGYRKVTLKNTSSERYRLVFEVYDGEYMPLAAFMNSEFPNFREHILEGLGKVRSGETDSFDFSGNRIGMKIRGEEAVFEDEMVEYEDGGSESCTLPLSELWDIIREWDVLRPRKK